ncbi:glycosyltransferase family 87 protein [Desulfobacula sp.]|uniref:glycosyltransferase family 87 protein n=1 Tax=Desulfobacula sp. TaxID=2593537 RepID=UPI00262CD82A|nr:glycosyltransferase family 87 protein [Desulfobacula sp.]
METPNPIKNISASSHPIKDILDSHNTFVIFVKILFLIAMASIGVFSIYSATKSLVIPYVYEKDFMQDYLLAQALLHGFDPYLPISQLAQQFIGELPNNVLPHPSPHPPPVAVLCLPFCIFNYEHAAVAWFLFEIICIFFATYLILCKLHNKSDLKLTIFIFLLLMAWPPLFLELVFGQLMTLLLLLLVCAWLSLGSGKNITGGIFIGLLIAIKLMAWPFIIFFAVRKNWSAVIAAGITVITSNVIAGLIMGFDKIVYYYFKVSAIVSPLYRAYEFNFSMWTIGWRLFDGTGSPILKGLEAPPIVAAPFLALFLSFAMPILLLAVGLKLALRTRSFDTSFGILVCVSTLVNPVAWTHYLILILIPIVIVGRDLLIHDMPKTETWYFLLLCASLLITNLEIRLFILKLTGLEMTTGRVQVPFVATLLTLIPAVSVILLLWLVSHMDHFYKEDTNIDDDHKKTKKLITSSKAHG